MSLYEENMYLKGKLLSMISIFRKYNIPCEMNNIEVVFENMLKENSFHKGKMYELERKLSEQMMEVKTMKIQSKAYNRKLLDQKIKTSFIRNDELIMKEKIEYLQQETAELKDVVMILMNESVKWKEEIAILKDQTKGLYKSDEKNLS